MKNYYKVTKIDGSIEFYLAYAADVYDFVEQPSYDGCDVKALRGNEIDENQYFIEL